ncbi:MAG: NRDE family protein [Halobacteriota archaeon]
MCTLTLAWQALSDAPVVVATNRDESFDRPARAPGRLDDDPGVVAPRDVEGGGTWEGFNDEGLFVGITNRWVAGLPAERSRGLLVRDALGQPSAAAAVTLVEQAVDDHEYDGFNLVVADADDAFLLEWDGHLHVREFDPGVHVVVNVGTDDSYTVPDHRPAVAHQQAENARNVRDALTPEADETAEQWLDRAANVLGDHDFGVCIHEDGFGTRSSSLIALGETPVYRFADGPPCEATHEPIEL